VQRALESYACKLLCSSNNPLRKPSGSLPYHSFALNSFLHRYSIAPLIRSLNFLHITSRMTSQQPASIAREHERSDIHAHAKAQTQTHTHNGTHAASGSCQATCHRLAPNLEVHTLIHMAHTHKQTHTHTHTHACTCTCRKWTVPTCLPPACTKFRGTQPTRSHIAP